MLKNKHIADENEDDRDELELDDDSKRCREGSVAELSDEKDPIIWERTAGLSDRRPKNLDVNSRDKLYLQIYI